MAQHQSQLDTVFLALADPTRRAVIARLAHRPAAVSELAEPFDMALPSFMKHIRALEGAGLIQTTKRGRTRICEIDRERFGLIDGWLAEQRRLWESRTDRLEHFLKDAQDTEPRK